MVLWCTLHVIYMQNIFKNVFKGQDVIKLFSNASSRTFLRADGIFLKLQPCTSKKHNGYQSGLMPWP